MMDILSVIEAILFAAGESVPVARLSLILGADEDEVMAAAKELRERYEREQRGMRILQLDDRLQMCSAPEFAPYISKALEQRKPPMLSQPALETLAVVAYFQPVTRAYVEQVRGVDSSYTVSALCERGLIEECGRLEVPDMTNGEGMEKLQSAINKLQDPGLKEQFSLSEVTGETVEE